MTKLFDDLFGSKFLKGDDLDNAMLVTIKDYDATNFGKDDERKVVVQFKELEKGLVLNKTNGRKLGEMFGHDLDGWLGKKIVIYPTLVDFRGEEVMTVRIRAPKGQGSAEAPQPARSAEEINTELGYEPELAEEPAY